MSKDHTALVDSELSVVSTSVLFNFIAMYSPDLGLPSRLYASGAAKTRGRIVDWTIRSRHE